MKFAKLSTLIVTAVLGVAVTLLLLYRVGPSNLSADSISSIESKGKDMKQVLAVATFAGGCFWCMQPPFDSAPGVVETIVGYTGGEEPNPSYELISTGRTKYAEAVQVRFDPSQTTYEQLLEVFWKNIDPTQGDGQFADRGPQYRTAIFFHNDEQKKLAEASKKDLQLAAKFAGSIVTQIVPATEFYRAEEYHQDYYKKNETHYNLYKVGSGRAGFIEKTWGKP